jgi:hypothetical protein
VKEILSDGSAEWGCPSRRVCIGAGGEVSWKERRAGPADVARDGTQVWRRDGDFHRDGGPAIMFPNAPPYWYREGRIMPPYPYGSGNRIRRRLPGFGRTR